jgi:hypothetical protein
LVFQELVLHGSLGILCKNIVSWFQRSSFFVIIAFRHRHFRIIGCSFYRVGLILVFLRNLDLGLVFLPFGIFPDVYRE